MIHGGELTESLGEATRFDYDLGVRLPWWNHKLMVSSAFLFGKQLNECCFERRLCCPRSYLLG